MGSRSSVWTVKDIFRLEKGKRGREDTIRLELSLSLIEKWLPTKKVLEMPKEHVICSLKDFTVIWFLFSRKVNASLLRGSYIDLPCQSSLEMSTCSLCISLLNLN